MLRSSDNHGFASRIWSLDGPAVVGGRTPDLYLSQMGAVRSTGAFRWEQIGHAYVFHVIEAGAGVFEIDGEAYPLARGGMAVVGPGVHARYHDRPGHPWRYRWFTLEGMRAESAMALGGLRRESPCTRQDWPMRLGSILDEVAAAYGASDAPTPSRTAASIAFAWRLIAAMGVALGVNSPPSLLPHASSGARAGAGGQAEQQAADEAEVDSASASMRGAGPKGRHAPGGPGGSGRPSGSGGSRGLAGPGGPEGDGEDGGDRAAGARASGAPDLEDGMANPHGLAARARFLIEREYTQGLRIDGLARRLRVSRATLFRHFKEAYGQSPKAALDELRLEQAAALLRRGLSSVKEVARACGYDSAQYFSRVYRARHGHPPSQARKA